jgi:hypothetical protein
MFLQTSVPFKFSSVKPPTGEFNYYKAKLKTSSDTSGSVLQYVVENWCRNNEKKFFIVFVQGGSPTPHPFSSRPHFVCKFSRQRSNENYTSKKEINQFSKCMYNIDSLRSLLYEKSLVIFTNKPI